MLSTIFGVLLGPPQRKDGNVPAGQRRVFPARMGWRRPRPRAQASSGRGARPRTSTHTLVHVEVCDEVHWLRLRAISLSTGLRPVGGMVPGRSKDVTAEYARSPGTKA